MSVWGTWDRLPLVTPDIQEVIYAAIVKQCSQLECTVITIGGMADHVHLLTGFPPKLTISDLIGKAKGSSSHLITHESNQENFSNGKVAMAHLQSVAIKLIKSLITFATKRSTIAKNPSSPTGN